MEVLPSRGIGLLLLCVLIAAAGLGIDKPPWQVMVDVGNEEPFLAEGTTRKFYHFVDFHSQEQWETRTVRWSQEYSALTFASAMRVQPSLFELTACRCHEHDNATSLLLVLNNTPLVTLPATDQWRRYQVLVPDTLYHPDYSLMAELHTPTWYDGERHLGVAVPRDAQRPSPILPICGMIDLRRSTEGA
jgi:hypothetical protein